MHGDRAGKTWRESLDNDVPSAVLRKSLCHDSAGGGGQHPHTVDFCSLYVVPLTQRGGGNTVLCEEPP